MPRDFILGYGSLLSDYSRRTYSGLTEATLPALVEGWRRGWSTRYRDEAATYAGVREDAGAALQAALVPATVTDELRHRERGYAFTPVDPGRIHVEGDLPTGRFWIVVNHEQVQADPHHPIPQTYVDTCMIGCLETGGEDLARDFVRSTEFWNEAWVDDRDQTSPLYPRLTPAEDDVRLTIDRLLAEAGILDLRQALPGTEK